MSIERPLSVRFLEAQLPMPSAATEPRKADEGRVRKQPSALQENQPSCASRYFDMKCSWSGSSSCAKAAVLNMQFLLDLILRQAAWNRIEA